MSRGNMLVMDDAHAGRPLHVRARLLPHGRVCDLWIVDGVITHQPQTEARTLVADGWVMPALVDAHLHLGIGEIGGPLQREVLDEELARLASSGVGAVRVLGSPSPLPEDVTAHAEGAPLPLVQTAGVPIAAPGRFFPGWGDQVGPDNLPQACARADHGQWVKIIVDWFDDAGGYSPAFPADAVTDAVGAVHAAGRRVAVHTQSAEGGRIAVEAGADSIEHGMHLPYEAFGDLAARGGILVPTGCVVEQLAPSMTGEEIPDALRRWFAAGRARHAELVRRAWTAGVTVLAGTDLPVGALVDEIAWLAATGIPAHDAIGASAWTARKALDLPRLREGDRADLIWMTEDPREDLDRLREPSLVVLGGTVVEDRRGD